MWLYRLLVSIWAGVVLLRRGRAKMSPPKQAGPHVWVHGASNGELASFKPLLSKLSQARPDLCWLVTANTPTGRDLVAGWGMPNVEARLAPVDLSWITSRVIRYWSVVAHVSLEAEIWPHRVLRCPGPVMLLGARMSDGTARGWGRVPGLARRIVGSLTYVSAQDPGSAERLASLGMQPQAQGPVVDLKAFFKPSGRVPDALLEQSFNRTQTWLAASTHEGDEEIVLAAHKDLLTQAPRSRLILAPRHPRRAPEVADMAKKRGLTVARRSLGEAPASAQVYLADTLGDMPLWYALSGRVFIGGTLSDRGGHTPYEPAAYGCALVHGPDVANFRAAFVRLGAAGAAMQINDAPGLKSALLALSTDEAQQRAGALAQKALRPTTDLDGLCGEVLARLP